jgi:hypothetical protein
MKTTQKVIGTEKLRLEEIQRLIREAPLVPLRQMLTDEDIYAVCREAGHEFRERLLDPGNSVSVSPSSGESRGILRGHLSSLDCAAD